MSATRLLVSPDAIRGYIRALRQSRKVSQAALAEAIQMAVRTYKDWELGATANIDAPHMLRAMRVLEGSLDQIADLPTGATAEDGAALARAWVVSAAAPREEETPDEARRLNRLIDLLAQGVAPDEAARIVQREQSPGARSG
jgi:transcriptional regulator with XRE-family HTH domain